jgi:A/G-specific adenine glycosylase
LPNKTPKLKKPTRVGIAYVAIRNDKSILLERRSEKGLLGGMLGWPGSDWDNVPSNHTEPLKADWHTLNEPVRHTFTHFHLELTIKIAFNVKGTPRVGKFITKENFKPDDLPTVMRKVWIEASKFLK